LSAIVGAAAALAVVRLAAPAPPEAPVRAAAVVDPGLPRAPKIDAAQIDSGRLHIDRMPEEIGKALELQSDEIVKTAEALEAKQARITGTCAPGSAIPSSRPTGA
jgi:hypothetical protein